MNRYLDLDDVLREHFHAASKPPTDASELDEILAPIVRLPQRGRRWTWARPVPLDHPPARARGRSLLALAVAILGLTLLAAAVAVVGARLFPSPAPVPVPTGSMTVPRADATATALEDGRALISGGWTVDEGAGLSSVELFDPRSGEFSPTGSMSVSRSFGTSTLLRDGRVLVAGGHDGGRYTLDLWFPGTSSADLYDPETGTFTPVAPMLQGRSGHTATLLPDGRVLVVGGYGPMPGTEPWAADDAGAHATAEIYDPSTGRWSEAGRMAGGRYLHTAIPTEGGVLVVGGQGGQVRASSATRTSGGPDPVGPPELFDPATGGFTRVGLPVDPRGTLVAAPLPDGRALLVGIQGDVRGAADVPWALTLDTRSGSAEMLDLPTVALDQIEDGPGPALSATVLADGRVLITGLRKEADGWSADVFDPESRTFSAASVGPLRSGSTITPLHDGAVLIAGGIVEIETATVQAATDAAIVEHLEQAVRGIDGMRGRLPAR